MADLSELEQQIRPFVGNCIFTTINEAANRCARNFFQRTHAWKTDVTISMVAGTREYKIDTGVDGADIAYIQQVRSVDRSRPVYRAANLEILNDNRTSSAITHFSHTGDLKLVVYPIPTAASDIRCTIALKPAVGSTVIPDDFLAHYSQEIVDGTLAELLRMKDQSWYDPKEAQIRRVDYKRGILSAINAMGAGAVSARGKVWV